MTDGKKTFENYLVTHAFFTKKMDVTAETKVLFCVVNGLAFPRQIMDYLGVSKGNLANYCKTLIGGGWLVSRRDVATKRGIYYEPTRAGHTKILKLYEQIEKELNTIKGAGKK